MPTLRAFECLIATAESGSITAAASRLHLSQPALSHQIAVLEREMGTTLFERLPRGVRATAAGREALRHARAAVDAAIRAVEAGRAVAQLRDGRLRIGCADSMTVGLLAPLLRGWRRRHPGVRLTLVERASADALAGLVTGDEIDVAVCPEPSYWDGHAEVLAIEELLLILGVGDRLADNPGPVPLDALHGHPFVHYATEHGLAPWVDTLLATHGVIPQVTVRTRQTTAAPALAAAGLGAAIVPVTAIPPGFTATVRRLQPPQQRQVLGLTAGEHDSLVTKFLTDLKRVGIRVPERVAHQLQQQPINSPNWHAEPNP